MCVKPTQLGLLPSKEHFDLESGRRPLDVLKMAPGALIVDIITPPNVELKRDSTVTNPPQLRTVWPPLELEEHPVDQCPPLRVVVVGAGLSGLTAGILLPAKVPNIDLVIYERHDDIVRRQSRSIKLLTPTI